MLTNWLPRMCVLPLISWRKRSFNVLVDALVNISMDEQRSFETISLDIGSLQIRAGDAILLMQFSFTLTEAHVEMSMPLLRAP